MLQYNFLCTWDFYRHILISRDLSSGPGSHTGRAFSVLVQADPKPLTFSTIITLSQISPSDVLPFMKYNNRTVLNTKSWSYNLVTSRILNYCWFLRRETRDVIKKKTWIWYVNKQGVFGGPPLVCVCVYDPPLQITDHISPKRCAATELILQLNNLTEPKREKRSPPVNGLNTI